MGLLVHNPILHQPHWLVHATHWFRSTDDENWHVPFPNRRFTIHHMVVHLVIFPFPLSLAVSAAALTLQSGSQVMLTLNKALDSDKYGTECSLSCVNETCRSLFVIAQQSLAWLIHYSVCASIFLFYVEKFICNVIFLFTANKREQMKISFPAKHSEYIIKSFSKLCKHTT